MNVSASVSQMDAGNISSVPQFNSSVHAVLNSMSTVMYDSEAVSTTTNTMDILSSSETITASEKLLQMSVFTQTPSLSLSTELPGSGSDNFTVSSSTYPITMSSVAPSQFDSDRPIFTSNLWDNLTDSPVVDRTSAGGRLGSSVAPSITVITSPLSSSHSHRTFPQNPSVTATPYLPKSITSTSVIAPDLPVTEMNSSIVPFSSSNDTNRSNTPTGADIPLGLAIALPVCIAVVVLILVAVLLYAIHQKRLKCHRKAERTNSDKALWMNTTVELPPLPPSPVSLENGHIIPLSQADIPVKEIETEYEVIHGFEAQLDSQLSLEMGQILSVLEKADNGWWRGCRGKKMGWFPSEYVKKVGKKNKPEILEVSSLDERGGEESKYVSHPVKPTVSSFLIRKKGQEDKSPAELLKESKRETDQNGNGLIPNGNINKSQEIKEDNNKNDGKEAAMMSPDLGTSVDSRPLSAYSDVSGDSLRYRAIYPYTAAREGELSLNENDVITYVEEGSIGWVRGRKESTDEEGWVPASYLQQLNTDTMIQPSVTEAFQQLQEQLTDNRQPNSVREHFVGVEHRAMYPYTAQHAEDLSFEMGDTIIVLDALENGWWHGLKGEETGWFPGSYVELKESGGSSPSSGVYDKGGNFLGDDQGLSAPGSLASSQNSSQADLLRNLSEALQRHKDAGNDNISVASASTAGSDETKPKPVRKAPAPPSGTRSVKRKILRRPSGPAPPPPVRKGENLLSESTNADSANQTTNTEGNADNVDSNDSVGKENPNISEENEKPPVPVRFVTPKMVKIPKKKLKLQNSNVLPSPPERPVPPRPPAPKGKLSVKNFKKKSKHSKFSDKKRGSVNKLSKADISGPVTLESLSVQVPNLNKPADSPVQSTNELENSTDKHVMKQEPLSVSPGPVIKQGLKKSQSHIPPPVAPKPKNFSASRLSQRDRRSPVNFNQDSSVMEENRVSDCDPSANVCETDSNTQQLHVDKSTDPSVVSRIPVPKRRHLTSSEDESQSPTSAEPENTERPKSEKRRKKKKSLKKAICNHKSEDDKELSFEKGSFIKQINEVSDRPGWYVGMLADGTMGLFHHSKVEDSSVSKHSMA